MGFSEAVRVCLSKSLTFSDRASRSEYWWFVLFVVAVSVVLAIVDIILFGTNPTTGESQALLSVLFQLAMLIPLLAASWRRLHDIGKPGWYILAPMIVSVVFVVGLLSGIFAFGLAENQGVSPDTLRGPAALLGMSGIVLFGALLVLLALLMIWWLTRPSDQASNAYGPTPS